MTAKMYALTIWQPWASLIALGWKPYEFRRWDYRARAPHVLNTRIVIHAGARKMRPAELLDILDRFKHGETALRPAAESWVQRALDGMRKMGPPLDVPLSAGVCSAIIRAPRNVRTLFGGQVNDSDRLDEALYAWPLDDVQPFTRPVPSVGAQGFWQWQKEIAREMELANK